jgi:hypothetical protein
VRSAASSIHSMGASASASDSSYSTGSHPLSSVAAATPAPSVSATAALVAAATRAVDVYPDHTPVKKPIRAGVFKSHAASMKEQQLHQPSNYALPTATAP